MKKVLTKKSISLFLVLCLVLTVSTALFACGKDNDQEQADVDVDVLSMPNEMAAYTQTNDINKYPDNYTGKTIRIKGSFSRTKLNGGSQKHNFIDVYDGCCSYAWVAFTWDGDLPKSGANVTVIGTIHTGKENGNKFAEITAEKVIF